MAMGCPLSTPGWRGSYLSLAGSPAQMRIGDVTLLYYALMHRKNPGHMKTINVLLVWLSSA